MADFTFAHREEGFDQHIEQSIRGYSYLIDDVISLSRHFVEDNTKVYDIGCSTGKMTQRLIEANFDHCTLASWYGIEIADGFQKELQEREKRLNELEQIIANKDAIVRALKEKVANALLGFRDKGLSVVEKDGKVYVSMDAKLLFASGSTKVDAEGIKALKELAKVLEDQQDLEILVEGHTDTDKMKSNSHPVDNWELSVLRATSVVKIMLENSKMDPTTVSASGRSQYIPIDIKDKAKNRRIEVVLIPKLDELFEIINN